MANAYDLLVRVRGDATGAVSALKKTRDEMRATGQDADRWGKRLDKGANMALGAGTALAAVVGKSVKTYETYGKGVKTITRMTGMQAAGASRLAAQWRRYGVDAETGATGIKFLSRNIDAARMGNKTAIASFERLGISLSDLRTLNADDILFKVRDAISQMGDATAKTAITLKMFGRGGGALTGWLSQSEETINDLNKKIESMGLVWGDKQLKNYDDAMAAQRELDLAWLGLQLAIAENVEPALTPMIERLGELLKDIKPIMPYVPQIAGALLVAGAAIKVARGAQTAIGLFKGGGAGAGSAQVANLGRASTVSAGQVAALGRASSVAATGSVARLNTTAAVASTGMGRVGTASVRAAPPLQYVGTASRTTSGRFARLNTTIGSSSVGTIASMIGLGFAIDFMANKLMQAGEAAQEMIAAMSQARQQGEAGKRTEAAFEEKLAQKYGRGSAKYNYYMKKAGIGKAGTYAAQAKAPWYWGPGAPLYNRLAGFAEGGVASGPRSGYLALLHGTELVTPLDKGKAVPTVVVNVTGNTFVGNSRDASRAITDMVSREMGRDVARLMKGAA